jgi:hypothetical protein
MDLIRTLNFVVNYLALSCNDWNYLGGLDAGKLPGFIFLYSRK